MATRGVIFDLDGTLIDSLADIAAATNTILAKHQRPTHAEDDYRGFIGDGIGVLVQRAWGIPDGTETPELTEFIAEVRHEYANHCLDQTRPFPGIESLLVELRARGIPLAVLSNKPDSMTQAVVSELFEANMFSYVTGEREGTPRKPHPTGARQAADAMRLAAPDCVIVGDLPVDVQTARFAGMEAAVVEWGLGTEAGLRAAGPDHWLIEPRDLLAFVE